MNQHGEERGRAGPALLCAPPRCLKQEVRLAAPVGKATAERCKAETHPRFTSQHPQGPCPGEGGTPTALGVGGAVCAPHSPAPLWGKAGQKGQTPAWLGLPRTLKGSLLWSKGRSCSNGALQHRRRASVPPLLPTPAATAPHPDAYQR